MTRAALYIRVSTEEQARHGLSLGEQRADLEAYAKAHGMAVVGVYEDAGISARKSYKRRPELLRLLEDCRAKKVDVILFIKLDRWFRNVGNYYAVQDILDQCGVNWQATKEDYETQTAAGRLKVNIMLSVAQDEADRASERIKFVFEGKRARREPLTGNTPTGYKIQGKAIVKDPETEAAVTAFFKKYLACGSVSETQAYILTEFGLRIEYQLASKMLNSPVYYGHYYGVDGMAPPYISKDEFDRILSMRNHTVRKVMQNRIYLFSGLIVCGECGAHLGGRTNLRNKVPLYNCPGHYVKRSGCPNKTNLSERKIEAYILDTLELKVQQAKISAENRRQRVPQKNYRAEISALKSKISKLKELFLNDLISIDEYKRDFEDFNAKISDLERRQSAVPEPDFSQLDQLLSGNWREVYQALPKDKKRDFWRIIMQEIRLYADRHIEYDLRI